MPVASRKLSAKTPVKNTGSKRKTTSSSKSAKPKVQQHVVDADNMFDDVDSGLVFDLSQVVETKTWKNGNISKRFKTLDGSRDIVIYKNYKDGLTRRDLIEPVPGQRNIHRVKVGVGVLDDGGLYLLNK